jgi:putative colanic acid biosynthesis glycosyltransferase
MKDMVNQSARTLFSIITINYNNKKGLERTFASVISQKFKDYELIIIDGNSNDGSTEFLNTIEESNVIIISENDKGIYDAMNKGLQLANGEYIIFMNSGDCFSDSFVLNLIHSTINNCPIKLKFIYGDTYEKEATDITLYYKKAKNQSLAWYGMFTHHQSMIFANDVLMKNKIEYNLKYPLSADWDFVLKFIKHLRKNEIAYLNEPISVFELGGFSSNYIQGIKEQYLIRREELGWNKIKCSILSILHFLLNIIRKKLPIVYRSFIKLQSNK